MVDTQNFSFEFKLAINFNLEKEIVKKLVIFVKMTNVKFQVKFTVILNYRKHLNDWKFTKRREIMND